MFSRWKRYFKKHDKKYKKFHYKIMPKLKKLTVYNSYKKEIVYNLVNFYRDIFMGMYNMEG